MSWDALAAHYDDLDEAKKAHSAFMDHLKASLPSLDMTGLRVLEFGCGTAAKAIECAHLGAAEITCADASSSMLAQVQRKVDALPKALVPRFKTILLNPEDRGSDLQGEFDLILVPFVLHHLPDFKPVIDNILHFSSKKATIVISEFGFGSAFQSSEEFKKLRGIHGNGFTPDQFLTFLQTYGFKQQGSTSEGVLDGGKLRAEREKLRIDLGLPEEDQSHQSHDTGAGGHDHQAPVGATPVASNAGHSHQHDHHQHHHGHQAHGQANPEGADPAHVHHSDDHSHHHGHHHHHDHQEGGHVHAEPVQPATEAAPHQHHHQQQHEHGGHGHGDGHTHTHTHTHNEDAHAEAHSPDHAHEHGHGHGHGHGHSHGHGHGHSYGGGEPGKQFLQPYFIITVTNA